MCVRDGNMKGNLQENGEDVHSLTLMGEMAIDICILYSN